MLMQKIFITACIIAVYAPNFLAGGCGYYEHAQKILHHGPRE